MKPIRYLHIVVALLCALCSPSTAAPAGPNILFILADDFGWGDLHCYGHPYSRTPNLDRLAVEGTRFQQFYATGVTCCPSRTGFMTGKFPATFHAYPANAGFGDRVTVTELLKKQGYRTGHFGKWHMGPDPKPGTYGIDSVGADNDESGAKKKQDPRGRDANIFDDAIRFIEKNKDGPFYVNVWGHISHFPVNPSSALLDRFGDLKVDEAKLPAALREKFALNKKLGGDPGDHLRRYLTDVWSMDEAVGRLLKRLDELGLRDNTIVVFSSDQGPAPLRDPAEETVKGKKKKKAAGDAPGDLRLNGMGSSGPFRGGKHNQYEGGVRIPFIIRWPGHVPAGRVDERSVLSGIDWLPTFCAIAGIGINSADFDGEDVSAAWLGREHTRTKPLLWKTSNPRADVAIRDGQWKLHHPSRSRGEVELYDLSHDIGEQQNVATRHPEVVKALMAKAEKWNATLPKDYIKTGKDD
jgi:arylsulfatase A-like enzyme